MGKLAGGFIDVYLLEKSRYICRFEKESFVKKKKLFYVGLCPSQFGN